MREYREAELAIAPIAFESHCFHTQMRACNRFTIPTNERGATLEGGLLSLTTFAGDFSLNTHKPAGLWSNDWCLYWICRLFSWRAMMVGIEQFSTIRWGLEWIEILGNGLIRIDKN